MLHPCVVAWLGQQADGGGVTGEWPVRKRIDLDQGDCHVRPSTRKET
jgi:hypothetical protein